jgi:cell division protease FtsH
MHQAPPDETDAAEAPLSARSPKPAEGACRLSATAARAKAAAQRARANHPRRADALILAVVASYLIAGLLALGGGAPSPVTVPFNPTFLHQLDSGRVRAITTTANTIQGTLTRPLRYPTNKRNATPTTRFTTRVPAFWSTSQLTLALQREHVKVEVPPPPKPTPLIEQILMKFGSTLLIFALFVLAWRRMLSSGGPLKLFSRSKARRVDPKTTTITFKDVGGISEVSGQLEELADFLRHPDRYQKLGGRMPRGVLLAGDPGTGKTLLARALAGEANAAFFSICASEFVEGIVGMGAARVRDLFASARAAAPAIVFIDELDAIGRSRQSGEWANPSEEREQTLNQLLTELDGFEDSTTVIALAATNRPEVLDPALLRAGRFDRHLHVHPPDSVGRCEILALHTRQLPLHPSVELRQIAENTVGMVGADLANLANEAALTAARRDHDQVHDQDFTDALERVLLGAPRGTVLPPKVRERTAVHEAGHALVALLTPDADPLRTVSIIPRGRALGVTLSTPSDERVNATSTQLTAQLRVALGGRVAEELIYGETSTGAENDIEQLTRIARQMIGRWGMSPTIGPIALLPPRDQEHSFPGTGEQPAAQTRVRLDEEVERLIDQQQNRVRALLRENREQLESLSAALLACETLDANQARAAAQRTGPPLAIAA